MIICSSPNRISEFPYKENCQSLLEYICVCDSRSPGMLVCAVHHYVHNFTRIKAICLFCLELNREKLEKITK